MTLIDTPTTNLLGTEARAQLVPPPIGGSIDPEIETDIAKFEVMLARYQGGELEDDVFRVFRLGNGIYGQRQGGTAQMVRVKAPYGAIKAGQLEMLAYLTERYSRGWGHITTRQNIQFHFVELSDVPEVLRHLGSVGLTTREACGDTVRNIQGCHLAGACPYEHLDVSPWAEAAFQHFVRNPLGQRLPRKFKINFSGCDTDCGQAMFNDVGVIATTRTAVDGTIEAGFRVFIAGGLGANPHPALALEDFTTREDLLPTIESCLRVFDQTGNRENKLRARMKWVIDTLGFAEVQRRVLKIRRTLPASSSWPGGIPDAVRLLGDAAAGRNHSVDSTVMGQGTPVFISANPTVGASPTDPEFDRWNHVNVVRGAANGTVSAIAYAELGDITSAQFRSLAALVREFNADLRLTNRQNLAFRGLRETDLPLFHARLATIGMAKPGAELSRDVVACPGADTCNLAVSQSRGLAKAIGDQLEAEGLSEVGGVRVNISGCMNSCGQHHTADIGFFGFERRAHGRSAPGYQMLLGGYVGQEKIEFGDKALKLPAKNAAEAVVRVVRRYAGEREAGERFRSWMERVGGAKAIAADLKDHDNFLPPHEAPHLYIDYDETGPYVAETGESECAV